MEPTEQDRQAAKRVYEALKELNAAVLAAHALGLHIEIEQSSDEDKPGPPHHTGSVERRILVYPPSAECRSA